MSVLENMDFENLPDITALPNGEYQVAIISAEDYLGKESGKSSIKVVLDVPAEATADAIYHYIALPSPDDDEKTRIRKMNRIKQFLQAFGLSKNMPYNEWIGHTTWALLAQEEDRQGELRNTVRKFIGGAGVAAADPSEASSLADIPF